MQGFQLPGAVWSALLVALPLLSVWLSQYFPGAIWAAPVSGLLLIVAKVIGVMRGEPEAPAMPPGAQGMVRDTYIAPPKRSRANRVLWG